MLPSIPPTFTLPVVGATNFMNSKSSFVHTVLRMSKLC